MILWSCGFGTGSSWLVCKGGAALLSGDVGGEEWDLAFAGVGFVPGLVEMWTRFRWYCVLEDSTKDVTAGKGSGGLA